MNYFVYCFIALLSFLLPFDGHIQQKVDDVVFGIYCGECTDHCATMYAYSSRDTSTLYVDSTDSYFFRKLDEPIICQTPVHDLHKIQVVHRLIKTIPEELLIGTETSRTFGCPDCSDQCGIYLEFLHHQVTYRFYIDTQAAQLSGNMKPFAEEVKKVVNQLRTP